MDAVNTSPSPQSMSTLYSEHQRWLQDWLRRKLGDTHMAADFAQDTFLRILAGVAKGQLPVLHEPRHYLVTIANRVMVDHFRRQALERAWLDALAFAPEPVQFSPEMQLAAIETLCEIDAMLQGLGAKPRQAFLMSQLEGLGYAEIAQRLEVTVSSVKKYMARATEQCLLFLVRTGEFAA
ncbi:sigma-70 family RNA polymerase sigma factor [Pigmentiphaga sp.]|uniref:sigma-70 family RNA polymerase sigma factor n=1 Tax=Pigmentiphaga sp. TaxID=1977564 RepID=UPI00128CEBF8|nr:sigma-70 family RNA polymerase sigma factor [Pigmentiphaga sp.]MPS29985.1 sigma-70 family RNA polymerase sigma factor [Alcaligenaceae bacterium SAGV5]MPS52752.1 sigma-70 family RNA polymerase sigma factor [Alcaligenaceae bacterium SAGV3]MPT60026.1 sigma-70 family RNA polymerase sigma factor [Alcaligenaceae bacterium]